MEGRTEKESKEQNTYRDNIVCASKNFDLGLVYILRRILTYCSVIWEMSNDTTKDNMKKSNQMNKRN